MILAGLDYDYTFNPLRSVTSFSFAFIISLQVTTVFLYAAVRPRMVVRLLRTLGSTVGLLKSPFTTLSWKVAMFATAPSW